MMGRGVLGSRDLHPRLLDGHPRGTRLLYGNSRDRLWGGGCRRCIDKDREGRRECLLLLLRWLRVLRHLHLD